MKINKLNESTEHPYMFQYSCNNSTFGYDFQCYAQELGAKRMYDHTQKGGGLHFYTVPSEDVYNRLKEVAKKEFTVDMYPLRPFDKERFANAKVQEAMTYYPSDNSDRDNSAYNKELKDQESKHSYVGKKVRYNNRVYTVTGAYDRKDGVTVRCNNMTFKPDEYELVNEAMTIAYSEDTIKRMISQLEKEIEDYKQLIIDEPEDKDYWEEEIKKCEDEIADLQSYEPLKESQKNEAWDDMETIRAAYDSYIEDCAWKQTDPISFEKFKNNYLGDKEESEEEFNSRIKYWAVLAIDKDTGKEYYAGVYESERWAYYWAGMDRSADAEYGYGNFDYRVEQVSEYTEEMDKSKSELYKLKLDRYDNRKYESVKRLGAGKKLNESSRGFYVTTYWPDEKWSPEEGGSMSYGWDANKSKFFRTEQEAQEYVDYILDGCEIISNYEGEYEYKDENGDLMKIALEPFHKRGKGHSPARSWVDAEFDVPAERPYFDRRGNRLARNPRLVAKEKRAAADLEKEFLAGIESATTRKELIDFISDLKYSKLFVNNGEIIGDKWKSLKEASYGGYNYDYEVHWISPDGRDCLLGASRTTEGAAEIAMNQLDEIMSNPFETTERKSKFISNLYIVKAGTEHDVTPVSVEEYQSNLLFRLGIDTGNLTEDTQYDVKMMDLEKVPSVLSQDIANKLDKHLRDNRLWIDELFYNNQRDRIEFDINWGDWKHEHLKCKWLMEEFFESLGITVEIDSYTTEEDGSDTYSAHYNVYAIER